VAPDSAQTHQAMADELQRDRDLTGTIANLRKALALDPTLPGIHFELAEALHASDNPQLRAEAEQQYRLAVEANRSDPKAAARLGDIEVEKGDPDAAATDYRKALELRRPDSPMLPSVWRMCSPKKGTKLTRYRCSSRSKRLIRRTPSHIFDSVPSIAS
jgi:cytochrome c-type biogenesis protein CcmH/NrfG